jgi:2-keto-4-pentenoate hydratase/2-oxohepta-3-ene-1,7-dioic acid hydratase in catechol pathway
MRWCRFRAAEREAYGIVEGREVVEVRGSPFDAYESAGVRWPMDQVKLLVPCVPGTFYAVGLNYLSHIREAVEAMGLKVDVPQQPDVGYRAVNALIAHQEPVVIPRDATEEVQYEGELAVVIGKEAKHLSEEQALDCVLGYTIGNDVSERSWQRSDRTMWRSKNTDTFKPMGPWIETQVDLERLRTTVRLSGEVVSEFSTNNMIFGVATYISAMSRYLTLHPGDVIWMGTDGPTHNMKHGDVVEVEISGIGTLRNPVVREQ